ncbi:MAG: 2-C-methyl-D-erythritol 4-phosphate cytidylyltransferase [Lachnospiraceae bacterium]|nr:2-C-methyl-D-erythritol 4-phosphate cytidylyltransferase [Lachnospiraceae bacterium]
MVSTRMNRSVAIVLAAGKGKRMNADRPKQYLLLDGKPILYYSLKTIEESFIERMILVTSEDDIEYCKKEIVEKYGLQKVTAIVAGGKERYHSVWNGICQVEDCDYLFIHDGARPFLTQEILNDAYRCVEKYDACVAAVPVKDTIKQVDDSGRVTHTPKRDELYQMQTPQTFRFSLIKDAYEGLIRQEEELKEKGITITDDAMAVETITSHDVRISEGAYTNIKITTPEDLWIAESLIKNIGEDKG